MTNSISICIVEDLIEIRQGLESLLSNAPGFLWLQSFASAEEAVAAVPALQPDIVIMDINLAGMDGIGCIRELKPLCATTQFIMFTINEDSSQVFEALEAGASGYLVKTTPPSKIIEALKELQEGGAPMSSGIARKVISAFQKKDPVANNPLSTRETEILGWLSKGFMYKEIAAKLNIATGTVRQHIHKIYEKLHVQNRTEAINKMYGNH